MNIIKSIITNRSITIEQLETILYTEDKDLISSLYKSARECADRVYGREIYIRGLIEFTNYCKNDCFYCGIRRSNIASERYRLDKEQILSCCDNGYALGFRTFVLQGGEDAYFDDERLCDIISSIKAGYPDCAVTLSVGEKSRESYEAYFRAGADRYLLRHETADMEHYNRLHPGEMDFSNRMECLRELKDIGYQTGCGFMVGSPWQSVNTIYKDLCFIRDFKPHMVGIGPFIPHKDTPFSDKKAGTLDMTLKLLSIIRLMLPNVLLPATTALGTINPRGRELGILSGANVVMPNLSPTGVRAKYSLYNNKICTNEEAAEGRERLEMQLAAIGFHISVDRGDCKKIF